MAFVTRAERERKAREYKQRVFPGGDEQQHAVEELLAELLPDVRFNERLYDLVHVRDIITRGDDPELTEDNVMYWYGDRLVQEILPVRRAALLALARALDEPELPSAEELLRAGRELLAGDMGGWPTEHRKGSFLKAILNMGRS